MGRWLLAVALAVSIVASGCAPHEAPNPEASAVLPRVTADELESEVRAAFGSALESVTVTSEGASEPTFSGRFELKGVQLHFDFRMTPEDLQRSRVSPDGPFLHERTLVHNEEIGGNGRFILLAKQFQSDFPDERSLGYWTGPYEDGTWPVVGGKGQQVMDRVTAGQSGPCVIVFDYNDFWSDGLARSLGVYGWDETSGQWRLLYRGELSRD